jgi:predicted unusual protein kinase regulating ubiquinone biosynthesis (AarF/ABC1/UbiB family)
MSELGNWTRQNLIDLGPTYVKFGQILSARSDIFCEEFIRELSLLQDECPPIEDVDVVKLVEESIDAKVEDVFVSFDKEPYKAASIGQVHHAVLKNGNKVVVKVQRPNIDVIVKEDLKTIEGITNIFMSIGVIQDCDTELLRQCRRYLMQEVDYVRESSNAIKMKKVLQNEANVKIPRVCTRLSTRNVIIMERIDGIKITELKGNVAKSKAIKVLIDCFVKQILDFGIMHGDPHPGNIAFNKDTLILYDFGLVIDVSVVIRDSFDDIVLSVLQKDSKKLTDILLNAKLIIPTTSKANIVCFFDAVFNILSFRSDAAYQNFDFEESIELLNDLGYSELNRPFTVSNDLIYLGKSLSLLDGICNTLDPDYSAIAYLKPYVETKLNNTNINFDGAMNDIFEVPSKVKNINSSILSIEKSTIGIAAKTRQLRNEFKYMQLIFILMMLYTLF